MSLITILFLIVNIAIEFFEWILIIYCVSSWIIRDPFNKFMCILSAIVDPVLDPIRNVLDRIDFLKTIPIDFSVLIAFILCNFVRSIIL